MKKQYRYNELSMQAKRIAVKDMEDNARNIDIFDAFIQKTINKLADETNNILDIDYIIDFSTLGDISNETYVISGEITLKQAAQSVFNAFTSNLSYEQIKCVRNENFTVHFIKDMEKDEEGNYMLKGVVITVENDNNDREENNVICNIIKFNAQAWYDEQTKQIETDAEDFYSESKTSYTDEEYSLIADANNIRFNKEGYMIETD